MKRIYLSVLAMCLILTLLLAGCGTSGDSQQKETTPAVTQGDQSSDYNELGAFPISDTKRVFNFGTVAD